MENTVEKKFDPNNKCLLQSEKLLKYILETSVIPREPKPLKELRDATSSHPRAFYGTLPDASQLVTLLLKLLDPKKTIEVGVFTGYSLLLTALATPDDAKITAIDIDRKAYEIGLPLIEKASVAQEVNFIGFQALPVLEQLLADKANQGSFEFAFVDADKDNYWNYHERLMKLIKVGGVVIYDNILWGGTVAWSEEEVPNSEIEFRNSVVEFKKKVAADPRVEIVACPSGDGITICRRLCWVFIVSSLWKWKYLMNSIMSKFCNL